MNRSELKAHLEKTEERVRRMTEGVSSKLDTMDEKLDAKLETFETLDEKIEANTKWAHRFSVATLIIVSLILAVVSIGLGVLYNLGL